MVRRIVVACAAAHAAALVHTSTAVGRPRLTATFADASDEAAAAGGGGGAEGPVFSIEKPTAWSFLRSSEYEAAVDMCELPGPKSVRCVETSSYRVVWSRAPTRALVLARRHADAADDAVSSRIAEHLGGAGLTILLAEPLYSKIGGALRAAGVDVEAWIDERDGVPDFVATLGGDGLLLYANSLFQQAPPPPVLAFSAGSLGFLAPFDVDRDAASGALEATVDDAVKLNGARKEPWPVSLRMRLRCAVLCGDTGAEVARHECLNEVVLDRGESPYLSAVDCYCDDEFLTTAQADGLIVATPTGSTAYALAAGGPMVHPSSNCIVFTPICPHSLSFRPIIFPDSAELRFDVDVSARADAWVTFDGRDKVRLKRGDSLVVTASPHPLPTVLRLGNTADWFGGLRTAFNFNTRAKQKPL